MEIYKKKWKHRRKSWTAEWIYLSNKRTKGILESVACGVKERNLDNLTAVLSKHPKFAMFAVIHWLSWLVYHIKLLMKITLLLLQHIALMFIWGKRNSSFFNFKSLQFHCCSILGQTVALLLGCHSCWSFSGLGLFILCWESDCT